MSLTPQDVVHVGPPRAEASVGVALAAFPLAVDGCSTVWRIRTCTFHTKGSDFGDPRIIYFSGERSEPVFRGAAGERIAKFKARMVNFMSKWDTRVVHG